MQTANSHLLQRAGKALQGSFTATENVGSQGSLSKMFCYLLSVVEHSKEEHGHQQQ